MVEARDSSDSVRARMASHPQEFGSPFVPASGTEGERLVRERAQADVAAGRLIPVGQVQNRLGLPRR